jgi:MFS transporter, SHS family, lactate transporter
MLFAPQRSAERFPTEVRATADGFCYHQDAIWGGLVGPVVAYFAIRMHLGFAVPMLIHCCPGFCAEG